MTRLEAFACAVFACSSAIGAQAPDTLAFALPSHPGRLSLNRQDWVVTEYSMKENGTEFGIRAEKGDLEFLGFLYPSTEKQERGAVGCREGMLRVEGIAQSSDTADRDVIKSDSGVEIATVVIYMRPKKKLTEHVPGTEVVEERERVRFRAFIGSGDLCGDMYFGFDLPSAEEQSRLLRSFKEELRSLQFDPKAKPTFMDAFTYATAGLSHFKAKGALQAYMVARDRCRQSDDPQKWCAIVTEQSSLSLAMLMGWKALRTAEEKAVTVSPDRPGPYLLLAWQDAVDGNAALARIHLQQAFDRRANVLPGEIFPQADKVGTILSGTSDKEVLGLVKLLNIQVPENYDPKIRR